MKTKHSLIVVAVGLICATIAVIAVRKTMQREAPAPVVEGIQLLLAKRDIDFGEPLILEGEKANVLFVDGWPRHLTPAGAITDREQFASRSVRAEDSFVRHQPILEPQIVPDDEFVPPEMVLERIGVDPQDMSTGRLRPGMVVDVLRVNNGTPVPFMRNVRIYAIGHLDAEGRPVKVEEPEPTVFLLIKKEDQVEFLKARYNTAHFVLMAPADPTVKGPKLADEAERRESRRREAQARLERGLELMQKQQFEKALAVFEELPERHPDVPEVIAQANQKAAECRRMVALNLCQQAREALEIEKDFAAVERYLDRVETEFADVADAMRQVRELRDASQKALEKHRTELSYKTVLKDLQAAMDSGNLPRARQLLTELKQFIVDGFTPEQEQLPAPGQAVQLFGTSLASISEEYEIDRKVYELHLKQSNYDQARAKLQEMREKFPEHPGLEELAQRLPTV